MEGGFPFGFGEDDEDELRREQLDRADLAIKLALDMTLAGIARINVQGTPDVQAQQLQAAAATVFPDAMVLVLEALEESQ